MPVTICGSAALTTTRQRIWISPAPRQRAARIRLGSIPFTPLMVLSRMGKKMPRKMMNWFCSSPTPNQRMESGIQASGGIGRSISKMVSICSSTTRDQPMAMPIGMEMLAHRKATISRLRLSRAWRYSSPELISSQAAVKIVVGGGSSVREVASSTNRLTYCQMQSRTVIRPSRRSLPKAFEASPGARTPGEAPVVMLFSLDAEATRARHVPLPGSCTYGL